MSLIQIQDLSFTYEGSYDPVFQGLSLRLDSDWRLGLVGRNGRGKTTLLRLLSGELDHGGAVSTAVPFSYFPPPVPRPEAPVLEALEELLPGCPLWRIQRELSLLEVGQDLLYRSFGSLSGGEQVKVLLAALFLQEGRFPLIDEPTNHLDLEGRQVVSRYLQGQRGFLLVSHDRAFLDGCVDHILAFNRQGLQVRQGNFSSWWRDKEARDAWERAEQARLQRDVARLTEAAGRTAAWSDRREGAKYAARNSGLRPDRGYVGHRAAKLMKRAKAVEARRQTAIEQKSALLKNVEQAEPLKLHPLEHPKARLLEAAELSPDYGQGPVCRPVSFTLDRNERVALTGRNGVGKSSLLRLVRGEALPHAGRIALASGLIVSYVPQDAGFLRGDLSQFAEDSALDVTLFKTILRKLDFSRAQFEKNMADYSAGQKKKVLLARSLCQRAHLYLWDEPLNYVDLFSRIQLEDLLRDTSAAMLLVEHDARFLEAIGARTVALASDQRAGT